MSCLKKTMLIIVTALFPVVMIACTSNDSEETVNVEQPAESPNISADQLIAEAASKQVEINVFENSSSYTQDQFMTLYGESIQKKYPNFSFNLYSPNENHGGVGLSELILQGVNIDLIKVSGPSVYTLLIQNDLHGDITDLIKKFNLNWEDFYPVIRETMESYGDNGEIFGIPNAVVSVALYYNKDLFEKFGVGFLDPNDPLTWGEVYELARTLTRLEDGIQYSGFQLGYSHVFPVNQYSQGYIDPETNLALLSHDNWRKIFANFHRFFEIDGNDFIPNSNGAFWEDGTVAMFAAQSAGSWAHAIKSPINWDMVELPRFDELPDTGPGLQLPFYAVAKTSENREQAFLAAAYIASEDFQIEFAKQGYIPPIKIDNLEQILGSSVPEIADKNLRAAAPLETAASAYPLNAYHGLTLSYLNQAFTSVVNEGVDINTALRTAEEQANQRISEAVAADQ